MTSRLCARYGGPVAALLAVAVILWQVPGASGLCFRGASGKEVCGEQLGSSPPSSRAGPEFSWSDGSKTAWRGPDARPPQRPVVEPGSPGSHGCVGDLPFGLDNCRCEGQKIGEVASLAACAVVHTTCDDGQVDRSQLLIPTIPVEQEPSVIQDAQRACDSLTASSCMASALDFSISSPSCRALLVGTSKCTSDRAMEILKANLEFMCEPLCPDCEDLNQSDGPSVAPASGPESQPNEEAAAMPEQLPIMNADGDRMTPAEASERPATKPHHSELQAPGCYGNEPLGFHALGVCTCDGATLGENVAGRGCLDVFAACGVTDTVVPPPELLAMPFPCDPVAQEECSAAASSYAIKDRTCAQLLFKGNDMCSKGFAREVFKASTTGACEPLCPECLRGPN